MNVAIYARVSTHDKDQNPETQLRPLRQHLAGLKGVSVLGEFIDTAGAEDLRASAWGAHSARDRSPSTRRGQGWSAPSTPGTSTALRRRGSSECANRYSSMHWRRSQNGGSQ